MVSVWSSGQGPVLCQHSVGGSSNCALPGVKPLALITQQQINLRCTEVEWVSKAPKLHDVNKRHLSKELGTLLIYLHRGFPENIIMILWFARQTVSNTADCKLLDYRALSYSSLMPGLISVPEPAPGHGGWTISEDSHSERKLLWPECLCPFPNSSVEILTPKDDGNRKRGLWEVFKS
ncbi:uncharacterized protein [Callorhinus ursinus]|uniref:uncharacterized protein isoform X3 n=1 Tax=Callorhinus ursinus TaxID=34884 RepID=UPI003CD02904